MTNTKQLQQDLDYVSAGVSSLSAFPRGTSARNCGGWRTMVS